MLSLLQLKSKTNYVFRVCVCSRRYLAWNAQLSAVACPALLYFSTLLHKRHDFRRKFYWTKMCVLIFCTNFIWNVFHSKNNWAKSDKKKCILFFTRSSRYSCRIWTKLEWSRQIFEQHSNIKFHENHSRGGSELSHADRRTDMTKLIVAFRNFAKAPKNG